MEIHNFHDEYGLVPQLERSLGDDFQDAGGRIASDDECFVSVTGLSLEDALIIAKKWDAGYLGTKILSP